MNAASNPSQTMRWLFAGGIAAAAGWMFYCERIGPLRAHERATRLAIAELAGQMESAGKAIGEIRALEPRAAEARAEMDRWSRERPETGAMVWFPGRMQEHFRRFGIANSVTRLNSALDEVDLPGFERTYWAVEFLRGSASREIRGACLAIAEIEPIEPSLRVLDVAVRPGADDPTRHLVVVNVSMLSPKAKTVR